jgi:hypothetical protein
MKYLVLKEPWGATLSQVCAGKLHWNRNGILEDLGWELLWLTLAVGSSIERGSGSITCLGVCPATRSDNGDQHATLPVTAVQLRLPRGAIFDQAAPFSRR